MRPSGLITSNPEQDFAFSPLASVVSHIRDMAYDEELAERVREALATRRGVSEKRMFGGLTFLVGGHMCCGIVGDELMVCVGPQAYVAALARRHARQMDFTGRPLGGYVYVAREGLRTHHAVRAWVERGVTFAQSLPPK